MEGKLRVYHVNGEPGNVPKYLCISACISSYGINDFDSCLLLCFNCYINVF